MNTRISLIVALVAVVLAGLATGAARACEPAAAAEPKPGLQWRQDGNDLVVTLTVTANGSPHLLRTDYQVDPASGRVTLGYVLIQNRDLLVRCTKQVTVEWRLANQEIGPPDYYTVRPTHLTVTGAEWSALLPRAGEGGAAANAAH